MSEFGEFWPDTDACTDPAITAVSNEIWTRLEARGGQLVNFARQEIDQLDRRARRARDVGDQGEAVRCAIEIERRFGVVEYLTAREFEGRAS